MADDSNVETRSADATDPVRVKAALRICELRWDLHQGRVRLAATHGGRLELEGAAPRVRLRRDGREVEWFAAPLHGAGNVLTAANDELGLGLELHVRSEGDAWVFQAILENRGSGTFTVEEVAPFSVPVGGRIAIGAGTDRWSVLRNGYQSWSGTRAYDLTEADSDPWWRFLRVSHTDLRHRASGRPGVLRSDLYTAIKNMRSGEALCLGFTGSARAFGAVRVGWDAGGARELSAVCDLDGVELAPGERIASEILWIAAGFDEQELLGRYASALGTAMGARIEARSPVGWCSWYHYFTRVDEDAVLRNLEALVRLCARWPCDYLMIDDGWQRAIGDWDQWNGKFPHGLPWLAERIRAAGMDAGIWLAPFIARPESRLVQEHPAWLVSGASGPASVWNPAWGLWRGARALDTTHPEALAWLEHLAHTLVVDWGFRILKLDFLFAASLPGRRYDRQATRAQALRRGLEAIRSGAGEGAFLLGCGCPLGPAIGVVDAMRIGPDVAPFWSNRLSRGPLRGRHGVATENAIRNTLTRAFQHRRLWLNDPDCLLVRDRQTGLGLEEVRSLVAAAALTDGLLVASDPMHELADDRLQLLEKARRLAGGRAQVLDLFERGMPEEVLCEGHAGRWLAVFNFGDTPVRRTVDVGRLGVGDGEVAELWTGRRFAVDEGWIDLGSLPAHGCRVLGLGL